MIVSTTFCTDDPRGDKLKKPSVLTSFSYSLTQRLYPEGNKFLNGLHLLDVADKHKLILPAVRYFGVNALRLDLLDLGFVATTLGAGVDRRLEEDGIYSCPITSRSPPIGVVNDVLRRQDLSLIVAGITFGSGQPFEGRTVVFTIMEIAREIERIINSFASLDL